MPSTVAHQGGYSAFHNDDVANVNKVSDLLVLPVQDVPAGLFFPFGSMKIGQLVFLSWLVGFHIGRSREPGRLR